MGVFLFNDVIYNAVGWFFTWWMSLMGVLAVGYLTYHYLDYFWENIQGTGWIRYWLGGFWSLDDEQIDQVVYWYWHYRGKKGVYARSGENLSRRILRRNNALHRVIGKRNG